MEVIHYYLFYQLNLQTVPFRGLYFFISVPQNPFHCWADFLFYMGNQNQRNRVFNFK